MNVSYLFLFKFFLKNWEGLYDVIGNFLKDEEVMVYENIKVWQQTWVLNTSKKSIILVNSISPSHFIQGMRKFMEARMLPW